MAYYGLRTHVPPHGVLKYLEFPMVRCITLLPQSSGWCCWRASMPDTPPLLIKGFCSVVHACTAGIRAVQPYFRPLGG